MAFRRDVGQAFRNDPSLRRFILRDVTPTGRILGTGFYGSVEEISYEHLVCAGKKLHETLIDLENEGMDVVVRKFLRECQLMSSLLHPNITQFLGLCFLPGTQLPVLVMERLETSLDDVLEHMPNLPLSLKRSVLEDVARGLLYLHNRRPSVIHRDLTAKNVLLTSSLVAKITDVGNSRIVSMRPGQLARTLTKCPGTLVYMPPEALEDAHRYGAAVDVFSFGHLALFTLTQKFPGDLLPHIYLNPDNPREVRGRTELERREQYIELLEAHTSSPLVELVKQCLQNDPRERPSTKELLARLQGVRMVVEGEFGRGIITLDTEKLALSKELKEKARRLEELTQQQARLEAEVRRYADCVEERGRRVEKLKDEVQTSREHIARMDAQLEEFGVLEAGLRRELAAQATERTRLREALRECEGDIPGGARKEPLPLQLTWRRGPNMPLQLTDYVQSVVVQGRLHLGGGWAVGDNGYRVIKHAIGSGKWTPYGACGFAILSTASWIQEIRGLRLGLSLSISVCLLLAVGGMGKDGKAVTAIFYLYHPEWGVGKV